MEKQITLLAILLCVATLVLGCAVGYLTMPEKVVTNTITTESVVVESYNDTAIKADIANIQATLDEDDIFEASCIEMATAEWTENSYKDIFKFIDTNQSDIYDREDIEYVKILDEDTSSVDTEDEDCDVTQEVKVRYETLTGDEKNLYLTIETEIDENEVDDQVIDLS